MPKSRKVEMQADSTGAWTSNMLRFATENEAENYGRDLFSRWSAVRAYRVVEVDDAVTHRWDYDTHRVEPLMPLAPARPVPRVIEGGKAVPVRRAGGALVERRSTRSGAGAGWVMGEKHTPMGQRTALRMAHSVDDLWMACSVEPAVVPGAGVLWHIVGTLDDRKADGSGVISGWRVGRDFATPREAWDAVTEANNPARDRCGRVLYRTLAGEWVRTTDEMRLEVRRNTAGWGGAGEVRRREPMPEPSVVDLMNADALRGALEANGGMWVFTGLWKGEERVPAKFVNGFGSAYWELRNGIGWRSKVPAGPTSRIQRELGLREAREIAPGVVRTRRERDRDGGCRLRAWVARAGCAFGTDATLVNEEDGA